MFFARCLLLVAILLPHALAEDIACTICAGAGSTACTNRTCTDGQLICPGPCLKPSVGKWKKVKGLDQHKVWRTFKYKGGSTHISNAHWGEVVQTSPTASPRNLGRCTECNGKTTIPCSTCSGKAMLTCGACEGNGTTTTEKIAAYQLERQKAAHPHQLLLNDGTTIYCRIIATMNGVITYKIDKDMMTIEESQVKAVIKENGKEEAEASEKRES